MPAAPRPAEGHLEMRLGPSVGEWRLPPANLLKRAKPQAIDEREVDAGGAALVDALAAHGVITNLVGRTVGPSVTRYELELGAGVKVARVDLAVQGHRLCHGIPGRSHPGPDPRQVGHRGRGPQPPSAAGSPRRHPRLRRGGQGAAPSRGGPRPGHRRPGGDGQPGRDAPRAGLGGDRVGEVVAASTPSCPRS